MKGAERRQFVYGNILEMQDEKDVVAEWCNKKELMKRWNGLNINTLNKWLYEMRDNKRFRNYVINPTHNLVFINIEGFHEFLVWKQDN